MPFPAHRPLRVIAILLSILGLTLASAPVARSVVATGAIAGTVTGPDGLPLPGAAVYAFKFMGVHSRPLENLIGWASTGIDGTYTISGLPPAVEQGGDYDHYYVIFVPPSDLGYMPEWYDNRPQPQWVSGISVEGGQTTAGIDAHLGPSGSIAGTVTGPDGQPMAGVTIGVLTYPIIYYDPENIYINYATTDCNGRYIVTNLLENDYYVQVLPDPQQGLSPTYFPGVFNPEPTDRVRVEIGQQVKDVDIHVLIGGSISGTISPSIPVYVVAERNKDTDYYFWRCRYSDDGTYTITGLPERNYKISFDPVNSNYAVQYYNGRATPEEANPVAVAAGLDTPGINASLLNRGTVRGRVTGAGGEPVNGVIIYAYLVSQRYNYQIAYTNTNGEFSFTLEEAWKLFFDPPSSSDYIQVWYNGQPDQASADPIIFIPGQTINLPDIVLETGGKITGTVFKPDGTPLKWAQVRADSLNSNNSYSADTALDGTYTLKGLPTGTYAVVFSAFGYCNLWYDGKSSQADADPVEVIAGVTTSSINAQLHEKGSITGMVTAGGAPLPFVGVYAYAGISHEYVKGTNTTDDGTYSLTGLEAGTYYVKFLDFQSGSPWAAEWYNDRNSINAADPVNVTDGNITSNINADLMTGGVISGRVTNDRGYPVYYMSVRAVDAITGLVVDTAGTGVDGTYVISNLMPGQYKVNFFYIDHLYLPQWYKQRFNLESADEVTVFPGQTVSDVDSVGEYYGRYHPPILVSPGDLTGREGEEITFTLTATDEDGDLFTFSAENLPPGAFFDTCTGLFSWTPGYNQHGVYAGIVFTVTDCRGHPQSDSVTISITVSDANGPPVLDPIGSRQVDEGIQLEFAITGSDPDGDNLTYAAANLPPGAVFDTATQLFNWTPDFHQAGDHTVLFTVTDDGSPPMRDQEEVDIKVRNVNCPPVLDPIGNKQTDEGALLSFRVSARDPDGDFLTYDADNLPPGAIFLPMMRTFIWKPGFHQAGDYTVLFTVTDNRNPPKSDSEEIVITVRDVNRPPVLDWIGNRSVGEGEQLQFTVKAVDPDGDDLTYAAANLPAGAGFDPLARIFNWTPAFDLVGTYNVLFTVTDDGSPPMSDQEEIAITVRNVNRPPVLDPIGSRQVNEGIQLEFAVTAGDPDGDDLTYAAANLPAGANFDPLTRIFNWTPGFDQAGDYTMLFTVTDDGYPPASDSEEVVMTVGDVNRPPVLDPIGEKQADEGTHLEFTITAGDPDGDDLTYTATNLPAGADFDPIARIFSWTPGFDQAGNYTVLFTVTDDGNPPASDGDNVSIAVGDVNRQPVLSLIGNKQVVEGRRLEFAVTALDPDGDGLIYSAQGLPQGAGFSPDTRKFAWTPRYDQAGSYQVTFTVADDRIPALTDSETITVSVRSPVGPLLVENFAQAGNLASDPDWNVISGNWIIDTKCRLYSDATRLNVASLRMFDSVAFPYKAGIVEVGMQLTPIYRRAANGALLFAYQDPARYRYVRLKSGRIQIGQVGDLGREAPGLKKAQSVPGVVIGKWFPLRVHIHPDGPVEIYRSNNLVASYSFTEAVPGGIGLKVVKAYTRFKDFIVWDDGALE